MLKLGKRAPRHDPRTLRLAAYVAPDRPTPPPTWDAASAVGTWGMLANDTVGDCTCAAAAHLIMAWTALAGQPVAPSNAAVLKMYAAVSGYDSGDPSTDVGATALDVLRYWRRTGLAGDRLTAYAAVDLHDRALVRFAAWAFEGLYLGVQLPVTAQGADSWTVVDPDAAVWGGHAINVVGYDAAGLTVITWGAPLRMSWPFFEAYTDEAYACLSPDLFGGAARTPDGFDLAALTADLAAITT